MTVATKSRGIFMSVDSVDAIWADRKTQTRRACKDQGNDLIWRHLDKVEMYPKGGLYTGWAVKYPNHPLWLPRKCPYGVPGDLLWVRETWAVGPEWDNTKPRDLPNSIAVFYAADDSWLLHGGSNTPKHGLPGRSRVGRFMPRRLARLWLRVVKDRVERVQEISETDAMAEGVSAEGVPSGRHTNEGDAEEVGSYRAGFAAIWDSLNAKRGHPWANNDWVWVVGFERVTSAISDEQKDEQ